MCNEVCKNGQQCKLEKNKALCGLHRKLKAADYSKKEVQNLNRTISRKSLEIKKLKAEKSLLENRIEEMNEDYENYQFIKKFELVKSNLKKYVNIKDFNQILFFCMQKKNHEILKSIMGQQEDYYKYYNEIRLKRNKLSHKF